MPPDWQVDAHGALEAFSAAYLTGNRRVAEAEFGRARAELGTHRPGRPVARAELVRCGVRVASPNSTTAPAMPRWQRTPRRRTGLCRLGTHQPTGDGGTAARALPGPQCCQRPDQHSTPPALTGSPPACCSGARRNQPTGIQTAVDTASAEGWQRRPLLAWLGCRKNAPKAVRRKAQAAALRRRIELVGGAR